AEIAGPMQIGTDFRKARCTVARCGAGCRGRATSTVHRSPAAPNASRAAAEAAGAIGVGHKTNRAFCDIDHFLGCTMPTMCEGTGRFGQYLPGPNEPHDYEPPGVLLPWGFLWRSAAARPNP